MASGAPARFRRSVYDVDRQQVSPFEWKRWKRSPRCYVRRMGLIESFFNTMGTLHEGRTDIFYRLPLRCPHASFQQLLRRVPLVWAILCRRHPLLCARVANLTPDLSEVSMQEANEKRLAGETLQDGSVSIESHFVIDYPETASELIKEASDRVVWLQSAWADTVSGTGEAAVQWLNTYVWNGKRRFLQQDRLFGLASLVVLPPNEAGETVTLDLVLLATHCIGDGLSVTELAAEMLQLLASADLPDQIPPLVHYSDCERGLKNATLAAYSAITQQMSASVAGCESGSDERLPVAQLERLLPPCLEASFPIMLPLAANITQTQTSRKARLRWFWSIRRIICQSRAMKAQEQILSDFKAEQKTSIKAPWWGAQTTWSIVRVPERPTSALMILSKRKRVRVGALLYSVATLALNTLEKEACAQTARSSAPTQTVIGFPMSIRKYIEPAAAMFDDAPSLSACASDKPSSLGVRLGFGGISLPPADLFSLSSTDLEQARHLLPHQHAQIWQVGRQAQRQFDVMFHRPHLLVADGFVVALDRENRFRQTGVQDVFATNDESESSTDVVGADERQPGVTKKNMQGPGSSLNFSMVGHLDPILPSIFTLPSSLKGGTLEVLPNLTIGVRNRAGEAFGTSFTFRGQLNLELGHDATIWDTSTIERFLRLMESIICGLVA